MGRSRQAAGKLAWKVQGWKVQGWKVQGWKVQGWKVQGDRHTA